MPKVSIDYSKTVFYKIVCNDLNINEVYVGHTVNFSKRKCNHKMRTEKEESKLYKYIRENGGWTNFSMIQIECASCEDGNDARKRERYWYEK